MGDPDVLAHGLELDAGHLDLGAVLHARGHLLGDLVVAVIQDIGYGRDTDIGGLGNVF